MALYGGRISPECLLAKVLQAFEEDRAVYDAADAFVEAGDYVTSLLAGKPVINATMAAAKALWSPSGYPGEKLFAAFAPELADLPRQKLADHLHTVPQRPGTRAGGLCASMASRLGLRAGIAVSPAQMDGYSPMLALGIRSPGEAMLVVGTSTSIMLLNNERRPVNGVTACLPDTYYPGLWGFASGQASVGDSFQWFVDTCLPEEYLRQAEERHMTPHAWLTRLASDLAPGENGLRALLEATAFGARLILDAYAETGVDVSALAACGGIAGKNPLLMQLYADVLGKPLRVSPCRQAPALGTAIYAAAAAGRQTGFPDIFAAEEAMYCRDFISNQPNPEAQAAYEPLYQEYKTLTRYFGRGENRVMERLKAP